MSYFTTKEKAEREGNKLLKRMKGEGWKLNVWETSFGWKCSVKNLGLHVHLNDIEGEYYCLFSFDLGNGDLSLWSSRKVYTDPNKAVEEQLKKIETKLNMFYKSYLEVKSRFED